MPQAVRLDGLEINAATSRRELILSTCWPFDAVTSRPLRYVLHATAVEMAK
jgi:sortase A